MQDWTASGPRLRGGDDSHQRPLLTPNEEAARSFRLAPLRQWFQWETIAPPPVPKSRGSQKAAGQAKFANFCPSERTSKG
jgi:hypothetical protein